MIILEVTSDWWGTGGDSHELPSSTIAAALADSVLQDITIFIKVVCKSSSSMAAGEVQSELAFTIVHAGDYTHN